MNRLPNIGSVLGLLTAILVAAPYASSIATAAEIHFVASELSKDHAIWHPSSVIIDNKTDLREGLVFVLENPTSTEHAFAVRGLMEEITSKDTMEVSPAGGDVGIMNFTYRPIRVTIPPHQTKRIRVGTDPLEGPKAEGRTFTYFCPIHKDVHLAGTIYVVR